MQKPPLHVAGFSESGIGTKVKADDRIWGKRFCTQKYINEPQLSAFSSAFLFSMMLEIFIIFTFIVNIKNRKNLEWNKIDLWIPVIFRLHYLPPPPIRYMYEISNSTKTGTSQAPFVAFFVLLFCLFAGAYIIKSLHNVQLMTKSIICLSVCKKAFWR